MSCNNNCQIDPCRQMDIWEVSCSVPYYTREEIDEIIDGINVSGVTEEELNEAITSARTEIEAEIPSLSGYSTTDEMNDAITEATSGKANSDDVYLKIDTSGKTELADEFVKYYLKTETSSKTEINDALSLKADPYSAGRAIDIDSANTISFTLPISAGTAENAVIEGSSTTGSGQHSHAEGFATKATNTASHSEGMGTVASGGFSHAEGRNTTASQLAAHAEGSSTVASATDTHAEGNNTKATNNSEHASGQFNVSHKENDTFGGSGNTLFSVGNGTANNARHNALEVMQNGDIYISSGNSDIKLQDYLGQGGGSGVTSGEVQTMINQSISGKTNQSDFSAHTANTTVHITAQERTDWNAKPNVWSGSEADWALISGGTLDNNTIYLIY